MNTALILRFVSSTLDPFLLLSYTLFAVSVVAMNSTKRALSVSKPTQAKTTRAQTSKENNVRHLISSLLDTIGDLHSQVEERDQVIDETQRVLEACSSLHQQCQSVQRAPQPRTWLALTDGTEDDKEDESDTHNGASDEEQDMESSEE